MTGGRLSGVSKRFSRRGPWVLHRVDLEVRPGSRTLVVGGNGSGKSTLLRIMAGVTHPTDGTVRAPDAIGYVPERLAARSKLTGAEYIAHMSRIKGLDPHTAEARSRELLDRLDLQPGPGVRIDELSKGNKQKLVLAQALLGPVALLILDEPFSGLDASAHRAVHELLDEAAGDGTSVLLSAHRVDTTLAADHLIHIGNGQLEPMTEPRPSVLLVERDEQWIELTTTPEACSHEQIAALQGVRSIRHDTLGLTVALVVERARTDSVLMAAIGMGWSVQSVGAPGVTGPS